MTADPFVLHMQDITKSFPGVQALRGVELCVRKGSIHALLGENGAGKSTLMKILCGVYPHGTFQGSIILNGKPLVLKSPHDAQRQGIGYVPQEISVLDALSVAENIYVGIWHGEGRRLYNPRQLTEQASRLLADCRIDLNPRQPAGQLNASQKQLVMIARAMSRQPQLLILDEATACLTTEETLRLFAVIRGLTKCGCTCLFITHKLGEVAELADEATVLRDGVLAARLEPGQFDQDRIITAMIGRSLTQVFPDRSRPTFGEDQLRVEGLTIPHPRIANRNLVEDVSFSVRRGEILGLGGLVGAGRSEVLRAIYGLLPCRQSIQVAGRTVHINSPHAALVQGLGLLTEDRKLDGLLFNFAIQENTTLHDLARFRYGPFLALGRESSLAADMMTQFKIKARHPSIAVRTLSGGNQQKVLLAKMLLPEPQVLLLDEPTKGIDVGAKAEVYALIQALADQGKAIVLVTSDLPELLALADRHVVLARGRITDRFSRQEANEHRFMRAATGLTSTEVVATV